MFIFVYNVDQEREIFPSVFIQDPKANQSENGHKLQRSFFFGAFEEIWNSVIYAQNIFNILIHFKYYKAFQNYVHATHLLPYVQKLIWPALSVDLLPLNIGHDLTKYDNTSLTLASKGNVEYFTMELYSSSLR